jgi:hypothetical protein
MGDEQDTLFNNELPADASVIKQVGSWKFFFAKSNSSFYVVTTDYHTGPLKLSMEDLSEFIGIIEKHRDEMEKDIVRDLEDHLASIIENEKDKEIFKGTKIKLIIPEE